MYGQLPAFSPRCGRSPGASGRTVVAGAGVKLVRGDGVRVPTTVLTSVDGPGAGDAELVQPVRPPLAASRAMPPARSRRLTAGARRRPSRRARGARRPAA